MAIEPHKSPRYEKRDASAGWLFGIVAGLLLFVAVGEVVLYRVKKHLQTTAAPTDAFTGARRTTEAAGKRPSFPRLQISPPEDLKTFLAHQEKEATTYGWIDAPAGVVRIPVDCAMDILLQRGFPVRRGTNLSRLGPTPVELQQQRTNATQPETVYPR